MRASLRGVLIWGIAAAVAGASSCSSLPDIDRGTCGNGVVEPDHNEDCDNGVTDDAGHPTCYPAGSTAACHFDCSSVSCPSGFSCGNDAVCRKPSGIFKESGHATQTAADKLLVGDFDHDGLGDVVAQTAVEMNVFYGDTLGGLSEPFAIRSPSSNPTIGRLALDPSDAGASEPNSDVVFTASGGVTTWRGRQDRTLVPTPYPSLQIGLDESRVLETVTTAVTDDVIIFVPIDAVNKGQPGAIITEVNGQAPDTSTAFAAFLTNDALPVNLVGDIVVAQFNDTPSSPCGEFALAFKSASLNGKVTVFTTCVDPTTLNAFNPKVATVAPIPPVDILLPSGATVRSDGVGAHSGDVNGDGKADLIVDGLAPTALADGGISQKIENYVSYSLGNGSFSSSPTLSPADNKFSPLLPDQPILAIGQLTTSTDNLFDFVVPGAIVFQVASPPADDAGADAGPAITQPNPILAAEPWTDARIVDIDGDGLPDVIAGSADRVDVYQGRGMPLMNFVPFAVDGTASEFAFGDFDGDRAPDVAFRASHGDGGTADLDMMWGNLHAAPETPAVIGRFGDIRTIGSGVIAASLGDSDDISDLGVVVRGTDGVFTVSVLAGVTTRQLQAPFFIQQQRSSGNGGDVGGPTGYSIGQLTAGDRHPDLVTGTLVERSPLSDGGGGEVLDVELAIGQSTGAAELSADPKQLLFTDKFDRFGPPGASGCVPPVCNVPVADWTVMSLATADLDGPSDNGVDEIIGIAPALRIGGNSLHDASSSGSLFWARLDDGSWKVESLSPLGSLPSDGSSPIATVTSADVNGDSAIDVLALAATAKSTTLLAYINQKNGSLPKTSTLIALPAYSTDPGAPFHIVGIAAIDADSEPGKEIAMLTDNGGLFLAKSNAGGDSFTVTGPLCDGGDLASCANNSRSRILPGQAIAAIDVDGDGIQDLVIESNLTLHVYKGLAVDP